MWAVTGFGVCSVSIISRRDSTMKKITLSMISPLLIGVLLLPGKFAFALDQINVTLPSKSFQFIIFPLARERGYMKDEGIDLNVVVMASTPGLQAVLAGEMDFTGSGSSALVAVTQDRKSTRLNSSHLGISYAVF